MKMYQIICSEKSDLKASRTSKLLMVSVILVLFIFTGCGNIGTAVMLWPPEESSWQPGDLLTVKNTSFLRNTYIVNQPGQWRLKEEIDQWRMRLFRRKKQANAWAATMGEWRHVYAQCLYQSLPMRSEPSNTSSRIYRFREGDIMKVLNRGQEPVKVGNLQGYWYQVLTEGGVEGYVFDYHLKVMRIENGNHTVLNQRITDDSTLENLFATYWRPQFFSEMTSSGQINLNLLRDEYGLKINRETQTLSLNIPDTSLQQQWDEIITIGSNRYDFLGSSFRITAASDNFISVQYNVDGVEHYEAFIRLNQNVNTLRSNELKRRSFILNELLSKGPAYRSRVYGNLEFSDDGRFSWNGKSSLISRNILSPKSGNSGTLELDIFINQAIINEYEGVLSFRFDNGELMRFLYKFENQGLRLFFIPPSAIEDNQVRTDQFLDPLQMFFEISDNSLILD